MLRIAACGPLPATLFATPRLMRPYAAIGALFRRPSRDPVSDGDREVYRQFVDFGTMPSDERIVRMRNVRRGAPDARRPCRASGAAASTISLRNSTTARSLAPRRSFGAVGDLAHSLPHHDVTVGDALDAGEIAELHRLAILAVIVGAGPHIVERGDRDRCPAATIELAPRLLIEPSYCRRPRSRR